MKKRLAAAASILVAFVTLGYIFALSSLVGYLATKHLSGKSAGERGKLGSIRLPFKRWRFHVHHWVYALALMAILAITDFNLINPTYTYGILCGITFQGLYCYPDWHRILVAR